MTNSILDFHAEATFVASIFVMKKIMSGFAEWEGQKQPEMVGQFVKRVSTWHSTTVTNALREVSNIHSAPTFVTTSLGRNNESSEDLHIELLRAASMELVTDLGQGNIGRCTVPKIKKWFDMMRIARENFATEHLDWVIDKFEEIKNTRQTGPDYQFFHPNVLFIYIAHMVNYYTSTDENDPDARVTVTEEAFRLWEKKSGNLFHKLFKVGDLTLIRLQRLSSGERATLLEDNTMGFTIPLHKIAMDTQKNNGLTSVDLIQDVVLSWINSDVYYHRQRFSPSVTQDSEEFATLLHLSAKMNKLHEKARALVKSREKQMRSFHKRRSKRNLESAYTPNHPTTFERDIFMMGQHSYYYHFCNNVGVASREFMRKAAFMRNAPSSARPRF
jgi:hypothetical protein